MQLIPWLIAISSVVVAIVTAALAVRTARRLRAEHAADADARQRAERTLAEREQMQRTLLHELGNTLHAIGLRNMLMGSTDEMERIRTHIKCVEEAIAGGSALIGRLREAASVHTGRFAIEPAPLQVQTILREALDLHVPHARSKGIELRMSVEPPDAVVPADRARLLQALADLLENAIRYTPKGGLILVSARQEAAELRIDVTDQGPGVRPEHLPHVFERYYSSADEGASRGLGLGLYLTRAIVEAHGGRIWIDGQGQGGATFSFTLPRTRSAAPVPAAV